MLVSLILIFLLIAILPLFVKPLEHNIEIFLLVMGLLTAAAAGALTKSNIAAIFEDKFLYIITIAVLVVSLLFKIFENRVQRFVDFLLSHLPFRIVIFFLIVGLGLLSSIITAIIASLLLTEIIAVLPIDRKTKVRVSILACFSIGLGAVLTPVGEPLSTIVTSKLNQDFLYMFRLLGVQIIIGVILFGLLGMFVIHRAQKSKINHSESIFIPEKENFRTILLRTVKIFMFVVALMLLGDGFKPIIDTYIIHWNNNLLYTGNMVSAILDNATLAAAEISPVMNVLQIKTVLISLLVSGGMMVTGNIPNIVTASKLKISMKEWAAFGLPVGIVCLIGYYFALFHAQIFGI